MRNSIFILKRVTGILTVCLLLQSCSSPKNCYEQEYDKVWNQIVQSKGWKESLGMDEVITDEDLYFKEDNSDLIETDDTHYKDKYSSLVSQAYFKIIKEAQRADTRISAEYKEMQAKAKQNPKSKEELAAVTKKYEAHKAMLSGLKSWNIFSEDRSGDLKYFKAENKDAVQEMLKNNAGDAKILNFLIYKLADLYHVEDN